MLLCSNITHVALAAASACTRRRRVCQIPRRFYSTCAASWYIKSLQTNGDSGSPTVTELASRRWPAAGVTDVTALEEKEGIWNMLIGV